mmetsp:Transcript_20219/g.65329  ORF Transcript_20219/g.65329 Transcript_20219/m.65329 type:complete len:408 (-) Transcript_20219:396-1619(-)
MLAVGACATFGDFRLPCHKQERLARLIYLVCGCITIVVTVRRYILILGVDAVTTIAATTAISKFTAMFGDGEADADAGDTGGTAGNAEGGGAGEAPETNGVGEVLLEGYVGLGERFLETWQLVQMELMASSRHARCLGSMDAKVKERPSADGSLQQAKEFAELFERQWKDKEGSLADELSAFLQEPEDWQVPQRPQKLSFVMEACLAELCLDRWGNQFDSRVQQSPLAIVCFHIYTMQDVDIDRFMLFQDVPGFPEGKEAPEQRDQHYKPYRTSLAAKRNTQVFQDANWGTRATWDSFAKGAMNEKALDEMTKYAKFIACMSCLCQTFETPRTTSRGLCGLPESLVADFFQEARRHYLLGGLVKHDLGRPNFRKLRESDDARREKRAVHHRRCDTRLGASHAEPILA